MADALQDAIALIKGGDRHTARQILAELVAADPRHEQAWLWLSGVVDTDEQRLFCVKQVLKLNPANQAARLSLASLEGNPPPPPPSATSAVPARPAAPAGARETTAPTPAGEPASQPAALGPQERAALTELIVGELGKQASRQDLIFKLCEQTGMPWPQAEALVREVEIEQEGRIRGKRAPLLIGVAVLTIVSGAALALPRLLDFIAVFTAQPPDLAVLPFMWRRAVVMVIGLAMGAGGALGLLRIVSPPAGGLAAEEEENRAVQGSLDDTIGVRVHVGSSHRRRRQRW